LEEKGICIVPIAEQKWKKRIDIASNAVHHFNTSNGNTEYRLKYLYAEFILDVVQLVNNREQLRQ
jgi:hypothetical protein